MLSKTSFFNPTVYKKNLTRFAPVWLLYTLCLILGLVMMYSNGGNSRNYWFASHMVDLIPVMGVINLAYALLTAQLLFGDLFQSRMCNALHAMPLRREGWFFTHVLSGLTFSLVPTAVMSLLALPLLAGSLFDGAWKIAFLFFAAVNLQYICYFGIAVFAVMVTANRFAMAAGYGLVNFGAAIAWWLIDTIYTPMLYGVITPTTLMENLTPAAHLTQFTFVEMDSRSLLMEQFGNTLEGAVGTFRLTGEWWRLFACAGAGIALMVVALLLYKRRNLECAGDAVAFKSLVPVFLIPCSIVVAAAAQFFLETFLGVYGYNFLVLSVGLVVGWFIGKMLLERTTRVFRLKNCYGLLALFAAIGLSLLLTHIDVLGIETSQPDLEDIKQVSIGTSYTPNAVLTEEADLEAVLLLQRLALEDRLDEAGTYVEEDGQRVRYVNSAAYQLAEKTAAQEGGVECVYATQFTICYELHSGKVINRRYNVWSDQQEGDILREIFSRWELVKNQYWNNPEVDRLATVLNTLKSIDYGQNYVDVVSMSESFSQYQTREDALSLLEAIQADCADHRMAQDRWLHNGHFRYPDAEAERGFYTQDCIYIYLQGENYGWSVEVYADSVHTLQWLQSRGLLTPEVRPENMRYW